MKIVHATWENRNLGCDAYEIFIERSDLKDFDATLQDIRAQDFSGAYVTLKMPVGDLKALHSLEDNGFRFMETQINLELYLKDFKMPAILTPLLRSLKYEELIKSHESWERIINRITPDLFTTDRIFLDPLLNKGTSCIRYQNWMRDLATKENSKLFLLYMNDSEIGFILDIYDFENKIAYGILGGLFNKFENKGLGLALIALEVEEARKNHLKKFNTMVSSNNLPVLKAQLFLENKIIHETYVLRKFFNKI